MAENVMGSRAEILCRPGLLSVTYAYGRLAPCSGQTVVIALHGVRQQQTGRQNVCFPPSSDKQIATAVGGIRSVVYIHVRPRFDIISELFSACVFQVNWWGFFYAQSTRTVTLIPQGERRPGVSTNRGSRQERSAEHATFCS